MSYSAEVSSLINSMLWIGTIIFFALGAVEGRRTRRLMEERGYQREIERLKAENSQLERELTLLKVERWRAERTKRP